MRGMSMNAVYIKQDGAPWRSAFRSWSFSDCVDYAHNNVVHGNNVQRIEVRDGMGSRIAIYDRSWSKEGTPPRKAYK